MIDTVKMTHDKAFEQDVRTMSYDELMEVIRVLDEEREEISQSVRKTMTNSNNNEIIKRAA